MENTLLKTKIAMLWVFICLDLVARSTLAGFDRLAAGKGSLQLPLLYSIWGAGATLALFAVPFLCVTLKDPWNRSLNIVLGVFFTIAGIAGTGSELLMFDVSSASYYMLDTAATVAPAIILFYAYRWTIE
jgi:hypothetical protein